MLSSRQLGKTMDCNRILIVDDNSEYYELMNFYFNREGIYTAWATNGHDALEFLEKTSLPNLILLDLHMPKMDGVTFCKYKAAIPRLASIPVIFYSSHPDVAKIAAQWPVAGFFSKLDPPQHIVSEIIESLRCQ